MRDYTNFVPNNPLTTSYIFPLSPIEKSSPRTSAGPLVTLTFNPLTYTYTFQRNWDLYNNLSIPFNFSVTNGVLDIDYTLNPSNIPITDGVANITIPALSKDTTLQIIPLNNPSNPDSLSFNLSLIPSTLYNSTSTPVSFVYTKPDYISLTINPSSVFENTGLPLTYTFTRTTNNPEPLTVYFSVEGTAIFGTDYAQSGATSFTANTGSITFSSSQDSKNLLLTPIPNTTGEFDRSISLTINSNPNYLITTTDPVTGLILDDDNLFSFSFDLLLLQDVSGSYGDDLATVRTVIPDLVTSINDIQTNTPIGLASFSDKPVDPFGESVEDDYPYQTNLPLSTNYTTLQNAYDTLQLLSGGDGPEAQLEALFQVALRAETELNFRTNTTKVVILFTDDEYHSAGEVQWVDIDNATTFEHNIFPINTGDTTLDGAPLTSTEDYPTIPQLRDALINANILPIFAVVNNQITTYENLLAQLKLPGLVVPLDLDSSNFVNTIRNGLLGSFLVDISPSTITITPNGNASCSIKLNVRPSSNVTLTLTPNPSVFSFNTPNTLTFTPLNWNIPQVVEFTDNNTSDAYTLITSPLTSSDLNFNNIKPKNIYVSSPSYLITPPHVLMFGEGSTTNSTTNITITTNVYEGTYPIDRIELYQRSITDDTSFVLVDSNTSLSSLVYTTSLSIFNTIDYEYYAISYDSQGNTGDRYLRLINGPLELLTVTTSPGSSISEDSLTPLIYTFTRTTNTTISNISVYLSFTGTATKDIDYSLSYNSLPVYSNSFYINLTIDTPSTTVELQPIINESNTSDSTVLLTLETDNPTFKLDPSTNSVIPITINNIN